MENVNRTLILNDNYVDENFDVNDTILSTTPSSSLSGDDTSDGKTYVPPSLINAENYFNISEEGAAFSSIEDLERAVQQCKQMVLESAECSEERKWLVRRLIELRFRLQESLDAIGISETNEHKTKVVVGHHFVLQSQSSVTTKLNCDNCTGIIWSVLHSWYQCTDCRYNCHVKCLAKVCRLCAHVRVSENPSFILDICPEIGLSGQAYRCAECKIQITFISSLAISKGLSCFGHPFSSDRSWSEPRRCDYDGLYYCPTCHWNNAAVVPARVVRNWDFEERPVARASLQVLTLMARHPSIRLHRLNPQLFGLVDELGSIRKIREDLLVMKKYLVSCKEAVEKRLLWQLKERQHMMESADTYSLQDLVDIHNGTLLVYLETVQREFVKHIKSECKLCFGQGYICELCDDEKDVIFPFDSAAMSCQNCTAVFHKTCWARKNQQCPKCVRLKAREESTKSSSTEEAPSISQ